MRMARTAVIVLVSCGMAGTLVQAVCTGTSVSASGAKGDGKTDDTVAIQSAINAAASTD